MSSRSGVTRRISLLIILALLVNGCLAGAADEEESLDVPTSTAVTKETAANRKLVTEPEEKPIDGVFDDANHIYYLKKANGKPCFVLKFDKADIEVEYYVKVFAGKSFKKGVASTKFSIPEGVRIYGICSDKTANNYLRLSWDRDQYTIELLTERTVHSPAERVLLNLQL